MPTGRRGTEPVRDQRDAPVQRLYTGNPAITLVATQGNDQTTYQYYWLATIRMGGRLPPEARGRLAVVVLSNPVTGDSVTVAIRGVAGQAVELILTDLAGNRLHQQKILRTGTEERVSVPVSGQFIIILTVSTATQQQAIRLIRP